ncbi:MAG: hypothetical protein WBF43_04180 [Methylocella sp.]
MDAFFALKTGTDRYVVNGASSNDFQAGAQRDGAILFQMPSASETSDGLVLLQTLGGRTHVAADPTLGVILQDRSAPHVPFLKVAAGDGFALGTPDKEHWLSVSDDGKLVFSKLASPGVSETFTDETPPQHPGHGCCGPSSPSSAGPFETLWNDETHKTIVMKGIECLKTSPSPTPQSEEFIRIWNLAKQFGLDVEAALFSGLHDADYHPALKDQVGGIPYYTSHFYDADTGKNYWGDNSPTALERGRDFFLASVKVLEAGEFYGNVSFDIGRRTSGGKLTLKLVNADNNDIQIASFKMLGVALHYLTDLTQPMHAANIANIYGGRSNPLDDWRHSMYEDYAESVTRSGRLFDNYPPLTAEQMSIQGINRIDDLYIAVAKASKKVWLKDVKPIFDKKGYRAAWGDEAKTAVLHSTQQAPAIVAKFLLYWIHVARRIG